MIPITVTEGHSSMVHNSADVPTLSGSTAHKAMCHAGRASRKPGPCLGTCWLFHTPKPARKSDYNLDMFGRFVDVMIIPVKRSGHFLERENQKER